jgi:hypothetical protein
MLPAFLSRETGWGIELSNAHFINVHRLREGQHYLYQEAAKDVDGTTEKSLFTKLPLICIFKFGGTTGYWTGSHTIIQTEYCIDCLEVIFQEVFKLFFLLDHSDGHAKKRLNGLKTKNFTKGWGGKDMTSTLIDQLDGFVAPFYDECNLQMMRIGKAQLMVYTHRTMIHLSSLLQ